YSLALMERCSASTPPAAADSRAQPLESPALGSTASSIPPQGAGGTTIIPRRAHLTTGRGLEQQEISTALGQGNVLGEGLTVADGDGFADGETAATHPLWKPRHTRGSQDA